MISHAALMLKRSNFRGANDVYARRRGPIFSPQKSDLEQALSGYAPYDVTGIAIGSDDRERLITRLSYYEEGQNFYDGEHWANPIKDGEPKIVFNFCRVIVDKGVDWFAGAQGWKTVSCSGNEMVADFLNGVWKLNNVESLTQRGMQFSGIKAEHYYYVTVRTHDRYGNRLKRKEWTVRIQVLAPEHVFPVWSDSEDRKMKACLIQFPVPGVGTSTQLYSVFITPEKIVEYLDNVVTAEMDNPIGEVNVVHCPNFELSASAFGASDIEHVMPLNVEYNLTAQNIRETIRYHAQPTTIIYGARASQLEKGANSVWSGLPKPTEAKVENLTLDSDLEACYKYLDILKTQICELSSTPKVAFDSFDVRVASSSAAALELMFQPIVEKTRRRRVPHKQAIKEVNRLVLLFQAIVIGDNVFLLADDVDNIYENDIHYSTPLPRDEAAELDNAIKKFNAGVWSRAEMIRQCANVTNHERLVVELIADKRAALAEAYEKQRALNGERPSSLAAFLGSECLSEEIEGLQKQCAALELLQREEKPPKDAAPVGPVLPPKPVAKPAKKAKAAKAK